MRTRAIRCGPTSKRRAEPGLDLRPRGRTGARQRHYSDRAASARQAAGQAARRYGVLHPSAHPGKGARPARSEKKPSTMSRSATAGSMPRDSR